jgi:hypothetical protein
MAAGADEHGHFAESAHVLSSLFCCILSPLGFPPLRLGQSQSAIIGSVSQLAGNKIRSPRYQHPTLDMTLRWFLFVPRLFGKRLHGEVCFQGVAHGNHEGLAARNFGHKPFIVDILDFARTEQPGKRAIDDQTHG